MIIVKLIGGLGQSAFSVFAGTQSFHKKIMMCLNWIYPILPKTIPAHTV
mgnify:FL=1